MTRKFKMVGVLMAVVAMFAVMASAAQAQFTSANYPATITASSTKDVFDAFGSTVTCTNNTFHGNLTAPSQTLTITPSYKSCTAFGLPATVNFTSCDYLFHNTPTKSVDIECTKAGDAIDIDVYADSSHSSPICHVRVPQQTGMTGTASNPLAYDHNTPAAGQVTLTGQIVVTATQTRTSIFCPAGTHTASAEYTIQAGGIAVSGNNGAISVDT